MPGDPRDHKRSFENVATSENDPANLVFEEWIKLREAQGWTREAAYTELMNREGSAPDRKRLISVRKRLSPAGTAPLR